MSKPSIPPYKPPKELQDILNQQAGQRKRTAQIPQRDWIHRNPRKFQFAFITVSLLVFFSRPIYDFFSTPHLSVEDSINFKKSE